MSARMVFVGSEQLRRGGYIRAEIFMGDDYGVIGPMEWLYGHGDASPLA